MKSNLGLDAWVERYIDASRRAEFRETFETGLSRLLARMEETKRDQEGNEYGIDLEHLDDIVENFESLVSYMTEHGLWRSDTERADDVLRFYAAANAKRAFLTPPAGTTGGTSGGTTGGTSGGTTGGTSGGTTAAPAAGFLGLSLTSWILIGLGLAAGWWFFIRPKPVAVAGIRPRMIR